MSKLATLEDAIELCRIVERIAPSFGCHVALTGGCLYKEDARKDIDIMLYRIRQVESIDYQGLHAAMLDHGIEVKSGFGWIFKATWSGFNIDIFYPEEVGGEYYPQKDKDDSQEIFKDGVPFL